MKTADIQNPKLLFTAAVIILFTTITGFYLYQGILKSADEIIEDNKNFTRTAAAKLVLESERSIPPVWNKYLKGIDRITKADERAADSLLSQSVQEILNNFYRVEGGFYFYKLDAFIGYSFPTISEPQPAFGPPPRSYNIIRGQVRKTVEIGSMVTELHQFDPAIFPLSTQPIYLDDEIIGAAWARIHLERKLETSQSIQSGTVFLTVGGILLVFALTIMIFWWRRKRLDAIKEGLNIMKHDPSHRLEEQGGVLGFISHAINDMTDTQQKEQQKRKKLERELYQKEKMAALGNLVAGTAHEINTPISIIKTRIQIWERKLGRLKTNGGYNALISDESLQIVHNEIERVSNLIKRLLIFSKPAGKEKKPVDLHAILKEQVNWFPDAFPSHTISFDYDWAPDLPPVLADRESLEQVITNVLKNAVEASDKNCRISIRTATIEKEELAEIRIRDYGSGLPADIKDQIFDPFFTTKHSGAGLGLSICNEIVKAHHGTIHFEKPGENHSSSNSQNGYTKDKLYDTRTGTLQGTECVIRLPVMS